MFTSRTKRTVEPPASLNSETNAVDEDEENNSSVFVRRGQWAPKAGASFGEGAGDLKERKLEQYSTIVDAFHSEKGLIEGFQPTDPQQEIDQGVVRRIKERLENEQVQQIEESINKNYQECFKKWLIGKNRTLNHKSVTPWSYESLAERFPRAVNFATSSMEQSKQMREYLVDLYYRKPQTEREIEIFFKYLVFPIDEAFRKTVNIRRRVLKDENYGGKIHKVLRGLPRWSHAQPAMDQNTKHPYYLATPGAHKQYRRQNATPEFKGRDIWPRQLVYRGRVSCTDDPTPLNLRPTLNPWMRENITSDLSYQEYIYGDNSSMKQDVKDLWEVSNHRAYGRKDRSLHPSERPITSLQRLAVGLRTNLAYEVNESNSGLITDHDSCSGFFSRRYGGEEDLRVPSFIERYFTSVPSNIYDYYVRKLDVLKREGLIFNKTLGVKLLYAMIHTAIVAKASPYLSDFAIKLMFSSALSVTSSITAAEGTTGRVVLDMARSWFSSDSGPSVPFVADVVLPFLIREGVSATLTSISNTVDPQYTPNKFHRIAAIIGSSYATNGDYSAAKKQILQHVMFAGLFSQTNRLYRGAVKRTMDNVLQELPQRDSGGLKRRYRPLHSNVLTFGRNVFAL